MSFHFFGHAIGETRLIATVCYAANDSEIHMLTLHVSLYFLRSKIPIPHRNLCVLIRFGLHKYHTAALLGNKCARCQRCKPFILISRNI